MEIAKRLRPITEEAGKGLEELKKLGCGKATRLSRIGLKTLDTYFLKHRLTTKTKHHFSFVDALKTKKLRDYLDDKIRTVEHLDTSALSRDELLRSRYNMFRLYYGAINQFRPTEAMRVYCTLKPTGILDFSAGWGGRCLAAMAYGVPYYGFDSNKQLENSYKELHALSPTSHVNMRFIPSEKADFSKLKYDLVFTSPPYYKLEEYDLMPNYKSYDDFVERFLLPVVLNAWKYLSTEGHMALNMPKEMYDSVKGSLPRVWKRMRLAISNKHPGNARKKTFKSGTRSETIYVWKKQKTETH
jgi:hypothetical protein